MNKISTLFVFVCSFVIGTTARAQPSTVDQNFETANVVQILEQECWTFNSFSQSNVSGLGGSYASMISNQVASATIATPLLNIPANNLMITFRYKVNTVGQGNSTLKIGLESATGQNTGLLSQKINVAPGEVFYNYTFTDINSPGKNINGSRKVVIEIVNAEVQIDDLTINAVYSHPGGCPPVPITLPVKLMNFQGSVAGNKAQLKWSVADNETGNFFQVLRSTDGRSFSESATLFVNGKVGAESYSFADARELDAVTYYKLKIVNKDGSVSYSNIIALKSAETPAGSALVILQNPVESTLNFNYTSAVTAQSQINIYSTTGVKVYSSRLTSQKGTNTVSLNLDRHLAAGTYLLEVVNGTDRSVTRLVKN